MTNSSALAPTFNSQKAEEDVAADAFLAAYSGATRAMYATDLRVFFVWCREYGVEPLKVKRVHLEFFSTYLREVRGNAISSTARRLYTLRSFYRIALDDEWVTKDPSRLLRIPKVHYDPARLVRIDGRDMAIALAAASRRSPTDGALVALLAYFGMRITEACSVQIENYAGTERGHRVLHTIGKGNKPITRPIPVPLMRALDACAGERTSGPLLLRRDGKQMDRNTAYRRVTALGKQIGIPDLHPHAFRHGSISTALASGIPLHLVQAFADHSDPRTTIGYDHSRLNMDAHASYGLANALASAG